MDLEQPLTKIPPTIKDPLSTALGMPSGDLNKAQLMVWGERGVTLATHHELVSNIKHGIDKTTTFLKTKAVHLGNRVIDEINDYLPERFHIPPDVMDKQMEFFNKKMAYQAGVFNANADYRESHDRYAATTPTGKRQAIMGQEPLPMITEHGEEEPTEVPSEVLALTEYAPGGASVYAPGGASFVESIDLPPMDEPLESEFMDDQYLYDQEGPAYWEQFP